MVSVEAGTRARVLDRLRLGDLAFRHTTRAAAVGVLLLLTGVIISLIAGSLPAFRAFGFEFLTTERWNPVTEKFGALAPIYGTIITSFIAMLIAVPIGLMIAFFLTELCPQWLRRPIGIAIELLAGIPSIIYGIWGLVHLRPVLAGDAAAIPDQHARQRAGHRPAVCRAALRHRHADGGTDPGDHGVAVRDVDLARCVRGRARRAQGSGLWRRLHDLGGGAQRRAALCEGRRDRRRDARSRPRARRDHGRYLRHRQCAPGLGILARARHHDLRHHRQRIHRSASAISTRPR